MYDIKIVMIINKLNDSHMDQSLFYLKGQHWHYDDQV